MNGNFQNKNVLVTGGAGFIGANLVRRLLREGARVHVLVKAESSLWRLNDVVKQLNLHSVNLLDYGALKAIVQTIRPDFVFHLATCGGHPEAIGQKIDFLKVEILGSTYLWEALSGLPVQRFVHLGSSLEYGPCDRPMEETIGLRPASFRGMAKAAGGLVSLQYAQAHSCNLTLLRLFSVYGYWEQPRRLIPVLLRSVTRGEEVFLTSPGLVHDWIFIEDVVEACLKAVGSDEEGESIFNIGSGKQYSNEAVLGALEHVTGRKLKVRAGQWPAKPWDTHCWVADIREAERALKWRPQHSLEDGLKKNLNWFLQNQEFY